MLYTNFLMQGWHLRKKDKPYPVEIVYIGLNNSIEMGGGYVNVKYKNGNIMEFTFLDIGKTIFLTKEELTNKKEKFEVVEL